MSGSGDDLAVLRGVFDEVLAGQRPAPDAPDLHAADTLPPAWSQAVDLGWPLIALPEEEGGAGGSAGPLAALAEVLGRHAVSMPIVETALVHWARHRGGLAPGEATSVLTLSVGPAPALTLAPDGRTVSGSVRRVPWGRFAESALLAADADGEEAVVLVSLAGEEVRVEPGANIAGEPRDALVLDGAPCEVLSGVTRAGVESYGAVAAAAATLGALGAARRVTRVHAADRSQFGRPLARFQLVGAHLAAIASLVEASRVVVDDAVAGLDAGSQAAERAAVAKAWTARSAGDVAQRAHQVHGAIGITREHELHLATRRLWSWRDESGRAEDWERRLGSRALAGGPQGTWDLICA